MKWKGYFTLTWESAAALVDTEAYLVFEAGGHVTGLGPDYIIPGPWPEFTSLALWFRQEPPFITVNSGVRVRFFREKYLKPHFLNVSREGEL